MELSLGFALVLSVAAPALVIWGGRRATVAPLLTITWLMFLTLWGIVPLSLQVTLVTPEPTTPATWTRGELAVLQSALLLVLALVLLAFPRPYVAPVRRLLERTAPKLERIFWPATLALGALVAVETRITSISGGSYLEVVSFAVSNATGDRAAVGVLESLATLLLGFFVGLVSLGRREGLSRGSYVVAWLGVVVYSAFSIARGMRSVVLLPLVVGIVALSTLEGRARRRTSLIVVVAATITIAIGAPIAAIMGVVRQVGTDKVTLELITSAIEFAATAGGSSFSERSVVLATELNRKFDEIGPGVEMLAMEPAGSAGLMPIMSAALSPIPRAMFPTKPVPTSRDGTEFGAPHRIAAAAYGDPEQGMVVPVSSTAIALWELGWLAPIALVIANVGWLVLMNTALVTRNVFTRAIAISMLGLPTAEEFIGPPSYVLQNGLRVALYLALLVVATLAVDMLRGRSAPRPSVAAA